LNSLPRCFSASFASDFDDFDMAGRDDPEGFPPKFTSEIYNKRKKERRRVTCAMDAPAFEEMAGKNLDFLKSC